MIASEYKAEEWGVAVATSIKDNTADENSDKYMVWFIWERDTRFFWFHDEAILFLLHQDTDLFFQTLRYGTDSAVPALFLS